MTVTTLKNLAVVVALLAGGAALAMIGFLAAPQITARQTSAPGSAPTAQHSRSADQLVSEIGQAGASGTVASPVATVQEAQPTPTPYTGPAQSGSAQNPVGPTTSAIPCDKPDGLGLSRGRRD
jgi:hypothetical protein